MALKSLRELKEERAQKLKAMSDIVTAAEKEQRDINAEEEQRINDLEKEINDPETGLDAQIRRKEKTDSVQAQARAFSSGFQTGQPQETFTPQEKRDLSNFSVLKMIRAQIDKRELEGVELELHQEAVREAKELGEEIRGFGIPSKVLSFKRDNSVTMPTQPEDGSAVVEKEVRAEPSMMEMLRNALITRRLGATYLNDLRGNMSFTRMTQRPVATWKAEVAELDKSNIKFAADDLVPKRLGTYTLQSLQFLRQTSDQIEQLIRKEIIYSITEAVDVAAIAGTGTSNQPMGVLNHPGVAALNTAALGTNGGALTRGALIALRTALLKRNMRPDASLKWLINAATEGALSNTPIATGSDKFILETERLLGYPYIMSNMVPSDLDKGTAVDTLSAIIFADWSELYIGQWGGIDLLVDPYSLATAGQVRIVAQGFFNVLVHRPEAFAYYKDATTVLS